jgi:hypothetical protein
MEQNTPLEIRSATNGYFIRGAYRLSHDGPSTEDVLVFRTFAEMTQWLGEHFTHRQGFVRNDHEG